MNRTLHVLAGVAIVLAVGTAVVRAETTVRQGDPLKIRLERAFNAMSAHSGDGFGVTIPEGLQVDPRGKPEIPAGTTGTATFRLLEKNETAVTYDISSVLLKLGTRSIEIKTSIPAGDPTARTLAIKKASPMLKAFVPPLIGFLIWKDKASLPAGKEINVEVAEDKRW